MKWLGTGRPWLRTSDGPPMGETPGVKIVEKGSQMTKKVAPSDGVYTLGPGRYRIKAGQEIPEGASFEVPKKPNGKSKKVAGKPGPAGVPAGPGEAPAGQGPSETA